MVRTISTSAHCLGGQLPQGHKVQGDIQHGGHSKLLQRVMITYYIRHNSHSSAFCYLTDAHIDERRKIKEDERPQVFAKGRSDIAENFHICDSLYENRTYYAK